jgi:EmrB/QacA subfamily drug resistance transporter
MASSSKHQTGPGPTTAGERTGRGPVWTLVIVSAALFMVVLDNLVVTVALPVIREDFGATLQDLEWTVNAYVLTFAVFLLTGATLGDRFGRRRIFLLGVGLFTAASAAAALAPDAGTLVLARAAQGVGAALVAPLTLTLLAAAFPADRRGLALGIWSGISGAGVALGPVVGGAVVEGISWQWIFWINVPIGLLLIPIAARMLGESYGGSGGLDPVGLTLAGGGLFGVVFGLVRGQALGWESPLIVASLAIGLVLIATFVLWERRTPAPMLDMSLFRRRAFSVTNGVGLLMTFGMFGSIFLLTQFLQFANGLSPWEAGVRIALWTGTTMLVAPLAGVLAERFGARAFMAAGLAMQAVALGWIAVVAEPGLAFGSLIVPFVLAGGGMGLVFAPSASALLSVVSDAEAGQASGANNAIREVGGVLGVAVLGAIFAGAGSYATPEAFMAGLTPAVWAGAGVLAAGSMMALMLPARRAAAVAPEPAPGAGIDEPAPEPAPA